MLEGPQHRAGSSKMLHFSQKNPGPSAAERENTTPKLSLQALLPRDEFVCSLMVKQILFSGCFLINDLCDFSHSKKDIPAANFTIHEIHCSRNLEVCRYCKESVPKSEMKNHIESEHVQVMATLLP